jgi:hypothetical protein
MATTHLIAEKAARNAANDCATYTALLTLLLLHIFGSAFTPWNIDLLGSFDNAQYTCRIFKFSRLA